MAEKRYQIFVSSTYSDLKEERQKLFSSIMMLNHIPAGMEFFGAVDEEQMVFIRKVIDESDYYVLLLGARYGSMDEEGISYTEREFDYAVSKGIKVIALLHKNPDDIPQGKTDKNDELREKFKAFRDKVIASKRLVAFWDNSEELNTKFQASLIQTIQRFPGIGWMRGDTLASTELLRKVAEMELENQRLREQLKSFGAVPIANDMKMEAASITNPSYFSDSEIECVSIDLRILDNNTTPQFFKKNHYNSVKSINFWIDTVKWFQHMLKICRFDLKITNPNSFQIENIGAEQHLLGEDKTEISMFGYDKISDPPFEPDIMNCMSNSRPQKPATDLNPKQSTIYTHHRLFIPDKNMTCTYQRTIFAKNIIDPIVKTIEVKYRVIQIELTYDEVFNIIADLEKNKKFNDVGVFEYATKLLKSQEASQ